MAKYPFKSIHDLYGDKRDELIFARIDDFDQCSNSWELCKIKNSNLNEDNIHQKRNFNLNMHENLDFEQRDKQYDIFCSKNAESCSRKNSKYHYETENQPFEKRNGYLPCHFSDYYIEKTSNDGYLAKTSPSFSEIYRNEWSENDDFEMSETQNSYFIKSSKGFDDGSGSKYHNERYIFGENYRCFPSLPDNCPIELTPEKRKQLRKISSLFTNDIERKWEKNDDFEQFENQNTRFSGNSGGFGVDRDSKYHCERDFFVRNNRSFGKSPENHLIAQTQNEIYIGKTPSLSTNNFKRKWEKNEHYEQSENQISCFSQNNKTFDDDSNSKYRNKKGFFVKNNNRCFGCNLESQLVEPPQNKRRCLRKTPYFSKNNSKEKWEKKYDFKLSDIQNSYFSENGSEFDEDSNSEYHNEKNSSFQDNRYLESNPGDHRLEIPQNKKRFLLSPSSKIFDEKWEKNNDFGHFEINTNCFSKKNNDFDDDSDIRCHNGKDVSFGNNRYFASNPKSPLIEMPQNKRRCFSKTSPVSTNNFKKKWAKNNQFEQFEIDTSCFSKNSKSFDDNRDFKCHNGDDISFGNIKYFASNPNNPLIDMPQNKQRGLRETPSLSTNSFEKKCSSYGDFEQSEYQKNFFNKNYREFDNDCDSKYYIERDISVGNNRCFATMTDNCVTELSQNIHLSEEPSLSTSNFETNWKNNDDFVQLRNNYIYVNEKSIEFDDSGTNSNCYNENQTFTEKNNCFYSDSGDYFTETHEKKLPHLRKMSCPNVKYYEKKLETYDNFVQFGKEYSFYHDKITATNECNDTVYKNDEDTKFLNESSRYLPNHPDNYLINSPQKKRHHISNASSTSVKKFGKNEDFEQSRKHISFSCDKIPIASDNADFIYNSEIDSTPLRKMHSCLSNQSDNNSIETPKKKTPYSTGKIYEKKWDGNGYSEQYKTEYNFSCDKFPIASDNAGTIYNREVDSTPLEKLHSCLPNHLDNNSAEMPKKKRHYKRKTPYSTGKIYEKKCVRNGNSEQYETEGSFSCDNISMASDNTGSIYNRELEPLSFGKNHSCIPNNVDNNFIETPKYKRQYKRKTPYSTGKIYEKKWERNCNSEQYETECGLSCNKIPIASDNASAVYNRDGDSTLLGKMHSYLPSQSDNNLIDTPKKKRYYKKKTPYSTGKIYEKKWERNGNSEQYKTECGFSSVISAVASDKNDSLHNYEQDTINPGESHNCFPSYLDKNFINTPKKRRRSVRKMLFPEENKCEKKQEKNGDIEQSEIQWSFSYDKVTVTNGKEGSLNNYKEDTRTLEERNRCSATHLDNNRVETPKMKKHYTEKIPCSPENKSEKQWNKNSNAEECETQRGCDNNGCHEANTKFLRERNSCSAAYLDNNCVETPKMKRRYIRKTPYSAENKCEKQWKKNINAEQCETQRGCIDNKCCREANTKFLRERNISFPSRFNDYIVETPNKKRPFSRRTPSSNSKIIHKKHKRFLSSNSQDIISYFSNCSFFKNPDFVNRLLNFNDKGLDDTFVTEKSKDVMLCSNYESYASLILRENQKTDDDNMHMCDYPQISFKEKDSDGTLVTGKSRDAMLYSDNESYECSILTENQKTNDDFICICNYPQACFNDKDSDDTFATETREDLMLFNDYEIHACSVITENQNTEDDSIHISECSHVFSNEINSGDTFVTERRNDVLLCNDYESNACPIITENHYTDDEIIHVGDCPQMIFDEEDLDDKFIKERGKDVNT